MPQFLQSFSLHNFLPFRGGYGCMAPRGSKQTVAESLLKFMEINSEPGREFEVPPKNLDKNLIKLSGNEFGIAPGSFLLV